MLEIKEIYKKEELINKEFICDNITYIVESVLLYGYQCEVRNFYSDEIEQMKTRTVAQLINKHENRLNNNGMLLEDLNNGQVVFLKNNKTGIINNKKIYIIQEDEYIDFGMFNENMTHKTDIKYNIINVFNEIHPAFGSKYAISPIWSRIPEVDWTKILVDTKVLVKNDDTDWIPAFYIEYSNIVSDKNHYVNIYGPSFTSPEQGKCSFKYCKLVIEKNKTCSKKIPRRP